MSQAKIFVAMPSYGQISAKAGARFWHASRQRGVRYVQEGCSLLAHNFNALWCTALNSDPRPDYFAMQHADIEPQEHWLDTLIEELDAHDLDVLSVVIPFKSPDGLTSTAIGDGPCEPRMPARRLVMREVQQLPETFTSEDVGGPLLINTGLWVCRFGDWAQDVCFTINDWVEPDSTGFYRCYVEPEDWNFSRQLHRLGVRVGATRKIAAKHWGEVGFDNQWTAYPLETDNATIEKNAVAMA